MEKIYVDDYILSKIGNSNEVAAVEFVKSESSKLKEFHELCDNIKQMFIDEAQGRDILEGNENLKRQKDAILGKPREVRYYKDRVEEYLRINNIINNWFPEWYKTLTDAIFQENWGLAGVSPWVENLKEEYYYSSSAKIIGDKVFFLVNGVMKLQPQRISKHRLDQMKKALIIDEPSMKHTDPYNDVFLLDGTRVTVFGDKFTKTGCDTIVFRKFVFKDFTFEKQSELGTIPYYSIEWFKRLVSLGYNLIVAGGPNTGKTTFYETMQKYEDPTLQGIQIETDPEVDMKSIMPDSPIMELLADGDDLKKIIKPILRGDPDYVKLGEARDGVALYTAVKVCNKGTRRVKMTYHTSGCIDICNQIAEEIVDSMGGSLAQTTVKVARSFDYVVELFYLNNNKNNKILKSIHEIRYDEETSEIEMLTVCKYNILTGKWEWANHYGKDKKEIGYLESVDLTREFGEMIEDFSVKYPTTDSTVFKPQYRFES